MDKGLGVGLILLHDDFFGNINAIIQNVDIIQTLWPVAYLDNEFAFLKRFFNDDPAVAVKNSYCQLQIISVADDQPVAGRIWIYAYLRQ